MNIVIDKHIFHIIMDTCMKRADDAGYRLSHGSKSKIVVFISQKTSGFNIASRNDRVSRISPEKFKGITWCVLTSLVPNASL